MPTTPKQFAAERGISERAVRKKARDIGTYRILGKTMWFEDEDVQALREALKGPCPSPSSAAARSGTTGAPSTDTADGSAGRHAASTVVTGQGESNRRMNHLAQQPASALRTAHHHEMAEFRAITLQVHPDLPVNKQRTAGTADTKSAQQIHGTFP